MCLFSQSSVHSPKTLSEHRNLRIYPTVPHTALHARATNKTKQQTPTGIWHSTQTNTADFSLVGTTQALFPIVIVTESSLTDHYNCAGRVSISLLSDEIPDLPCSYCRYEFTPKNTPTQMEDFPGGDFRFMRAASSWEWKTARVREAQPQHNDAKQQQWKNTLLLKTNAPLALERWQRRLHLR